LNHTATNGNIVPAPAKFETDQRGFFAAMKILTCRQGCWSGGGVMKRLLLAGLLGFAPATAPAAAIDQLPYASLTGAFGATFDDLPHPASATFYNGLIASGGVIFSERFEKQALSYAGDFDVLDGIPRSPLLPQRGAVGHNVAVSVASSNYVLGVGPSSDIEASLGEGALAALFSTNQSQFGMRIVGGDGGDLFMSFFRNDGSLIEMVTLSNVQDGLYGFSRAGGIADIRGISFHNNDSGGLGLDDLKFDARSSYGTALLPEPAAWALMIGGFGLTGAMLRRRRPALARRG
jgi:hypothetical protein